MTTPTNSNRLREIEEFYATDVEDAKEWHSFPPTKEGDVAFLLSEIEKLAAEKAETIEVLEALREGDIADPHFDMAGWWVECGEPHLRKLKGES